MTMHPRFRRRRTTVREHRARRFFRRSLILAAGLAVGAGTVWLAQSDLFSVNEIEINGVTRADLSPALLQADVYEGRPLILVQTDKVEEAAVRDPWVQEVSVRRVFPDKVVIDVVERFPLLTAMAGSQWAVLANDGRIMSVLDEPLVSLPQVELPVGRVPVGVFVDDSEIAGVMDFVAHLPLSLRQLRVWTSGGELWASLGGHDVRLGSAADGGHKALTVTGLIEAGTLRAGDVIDVVAPARPAVRPAVTPTVTPTDS
jgi:hypothetical protein